jgi:hypothetical protein
MIFTQNKNSKVNLPEVNNKHEDNQITDQAAIWICK